MRKWSPTEVDNERLTWIRVYGIPFHAWNEDFFKFPVLGTGEYLAADENSEKKNVLWMLLEFLWRNVYDKSCGRLVWTASVD